MEIIDIHAHIFPDKIAEKASASIGKFYDIPMRYDGTVSTLLALKKQSGIGRLAVHSVATAPQQVESINSYIAGTVSEHPSELIGFATLHPDYESIGAEVERAISLGLRGIKIHPDFQRFNVDCQKACRIYEAVEGRLPVLIHTGDYRTDYSKPRRILQILRMFPKLDVICAHFGGWSEWDEAAKTLAGQRIWVDTSSSLFQVSPERARELIRMYGADRVLFGTDYPMWSPAEELERFNQIDLSDGEREKIFHINAERLLGLEENAVK